MSDDKLDIDDLNLLDGDDETYEIVTMTDDDGTETDFFIVDGITDNNNRYLLLVKEEDFELDEPEAFIFKEIEAEGEDYIYEPVDDDDEYNKILVLLQDEDSDYEMKF